MSTCSGVRCLDSSPSFLACNCVTLGGLPVFLVCEKVSKKAPQSVPGTW